MKYFINNIEVDESKFKTMFLGARYVEEGDDLALNLIRAYIAATTAPKQVEEIAAILEEFEFNRCFGNKKHYVIGAIHFHVQEEEGEDING